jgi:hypothetical protein
MDGYKLAIGEVVEWTSALAYKDGGKACEARLLLQAKRLDEPALRALKSREGQTVADLLVEQAVGWEQTLVQAEDGSPAPYSPDALRCLLTLPGAANLLFADYVRACSAEAARGN